MQYLPAPVKTLESLHDEMVCESIHYADIRARVARTLGLDRTLNDKWDATQARMDRFLDELQVLHALENAVEVGDES